VAVIGPQLASSASSLPGLPAQAALVEHKGRQGAWWCRGLSEAGNGIAGIPTHPTIPLKGIDSSIHV